MNDSGKKVLWAVILIIILGGLSFIFSDRTAQPEVLDDEATLGAENQMSFFVTSKNPGVGANFGGLSGADQYCQTLASDVGAGEKNWRAYLSAVATETEGAVNARDRIGAGPWYNAKNVLVANNVEELHATNTISKETALDEKGQMINGRGDTPNLHDILTGSLPDGTASAEEGDTTCRNWTSDGEGTALVGHHDRMGLDNGEAAKSWNSSHPSRGCSLENLASSGGGGLLYCFAVTE